MPARIRPADGTRAAYTPREVAKSIGQPYKWVLERIKKGELRATKYGKYYVITPDAVDDFVKAQAAS